MYDPHDFERFPGPLWDLAAPAEIRRRGESRARRRRGAAAVAGVAMMALVATPIMAGAGLTKSGEVVASDSSHVPSSTGAGIQGALASIDLASGLHTTTHTSSSADHDVLSLVRICGDSSWSGGRDVVAPDVRVVSGLDASGAAARRTLLDYPDEAAARDALRAVRRTAASCSTAGGTAEHAIALGIGDEPESWSWAYAFPRGARLGPTGGTGALLTARVGTFLLINQAAGDASADASPEEHLSQEVFRLLREMCDLEGTSC